MAGSQDVFDAIVMADERFHGEGYQEGYEEGSSLGIIEGRRHGTLHGAKIGSEQRSRQCGWRNVLGTERQSRLLYKDAWSPCALRVLRLVQVEVLWQPRVGQVCWCHCSNSICSLHVSASHFGTSRKIGCYQGFAFAWRCLLHSCATEKDRFGPPPYPNVRRGMPAADCG
ncbi:protein LTO1 homolog isoform X2 [Lynx rufus]|uniref:protein LTO1 homolog isoform X2 n=1 Tax=Lynx rufus TaxID=61384 RepID=UPI001F12619F|nr:protein LTO1 homolog isoform X2 [Lynx rufus]